MSPCFFEAPVFFKASREGPKKFMYSIFKGSRPILNTDFCTLFRKLARIFKNDEFAAGGNVLSNLENFPN
jgi:hypothetical protein